MENNAENNQLNMSTNLFAGGGWKIGDVSNCPVSFGISNRTYIGLGFLDRIRVLFGKEICVNIDFEVDKEVNILKTEAKTTIQPFFKLKPNKNDFMQQSDRVVAN